MRYAKFSGLCAAVVAGVGLVSTASAVPITIDMVTVGNPGNAGRTYTASDNNSYTHGAVNYVYQIGKYEVTATQYTAFLNAVAATDNKSV